MNKITRVGILLSAFLTLYGTSLPVTENIDFQAITRKQSASTLYIKKAFNKIDSSLDYLLTTKGAIKTLILISPLLYSYTYYFDTEPVQELLSQIVRYASKSGTLYELQKEVGKQDAIWEFIYNDPLSATKIAAGNSLQALVTKLFK